MREGRRFTDPGVAMSREAVMKWLGLAPLPVVLMICLTTTGTLAGWVWAIAGELKDQKTIVAVAVEQATVAKTITERADDKLDVLLIGITELRGDLAALRIEVERARQEKK